MEHSKFEKRPKGSCHGPMMNFCVGNRSLINSVRNVTKRVQRHVPYTVRTSWIMDAPRADKGCGFGSSWPSKRVCNILNGLLSGACSLRFRHDTSHGFPIANSLALLIITLEPEVHGMRVYSGCPVSYCLQRLLHILVFSATFSALAGLRVGSCYRLSYPLFFHAHPWIPSNRILFRHPHQPSPYTTFAADKPEKQPEGSWASIRG